MDEGTRAIIEKITRMICDAQYEKIEKATKENNEYLDRKFLCLEKHIEEVKEVVDEIKINNCTICLTHIAEQKEKEKKIIKNVVVVSTTIPTIILIGSWIKGIIIGWIQKPPTQ